MKFQKTLLAVASAAMAFGPFASTMPVCANGFQMKTLLPKVQL